MNSILTPLPKLLSCGLWLLLAATLGSTSAIALAQPPQGSPQEAPGDGEEDLDLGSDGTDSEEADSTSATGAAQDTSEVEIRMPVQVIAGRLITRCEISTRFRRIPGTFLIDFDRKCGLELHNRAADGIRVDTDGGVPMVLHFPGANLQIARREHGDEESLEEITRLYSKELGETACIGTLGADLLQNYQVTFALSEGFVYLRPPRDRDDAAPAQQPGEIVTSITLTNDLVWLPVRLADDRVLSMSISTRHMDSWVNVDLAEDLDAADGAVGRVMLKTLDLSKYVAFRPEPIMQVHPDGVFGNMGLNLLELLTVDIDRVNQRATLRLVKQAEFPESDLAFFRARLEQEPAPLVKFLEEYPQSRLAREGAELLLELQLEFGAEAKEFSLALEWIDKTRIEDLRCTEALDIMQVLLQADRTDVAILAGELGAKSGRDDRYPESVHKVHAKLGELLLNTADTSKAWEHLLSAAFGLPDDGWINLHLGQFYEREGRLRRAMSRYIQAVITPEAGALAVAGLERVQERLGGERLSVDLVDRMVSGKVHNFAAATRWQQEEDSGNRGVLCELYTNPHFGRPLTEGWRSFAVGGAMAIEGILSHFPRDRVAVLSYQIDIPEPHALYNALTESMVRQYGISEPTLLKINGTVNGPGAGRWRQAEQIYERNRESISDLLRQSSDFSLSLDAAVEGERVHGELNVEGPAQSRDSWRVQLILAERGVLYPGKGKIVVHRYVARAPLTDNLDGTPYAPVNGVMKLRFDRDLKQLVADNEAFLTRYEKQGGGITTRLSTQIDPRQLSLVALIRDVSNGAVLQVIQVDPKGAEPIED